MVVLDSSFLVAYHNRGDVRHGAAAAGMARLLAGDWGAALLREHVFLEVVTVRLARRGLEVAGRVGTLLLGAREVELVPSSDLLLDTSEVFRTQAHGRWSVADAAIVALARARQAPLVRDVPGLTVVAR
jgi:predicted nucleic acid-binding protein